MIGEQHRGTMAQFFQANLVGREQREAGSGTVWLVDFWLKSAAEQRKEIAAWAASQKTALQATADQHLAALDDLRLHAANGNRAERRAAARAKPKAVKKAGPVKKAKPVAVKP